MLNYIKSDIYRVCTRVSFIVWCVFLVAFPGFFIYSMSRSQNTPANITPLLLGAMYLIFFVFTFYISNCSFRSGIIIGTAKNDMTNGVSRTGIYLSKFLFCVIGIGVMHLLFASSCILFTSFAFGISQGLSLLKTMTEARRFMLFMEYVFYLAVFQALCLLVRKKFILMLILIGTGVFLTAVQNLLSGIVPGIAAFIEIIDARSLEESTPLAGFIPPLLAQITGIVSVSVLGGAFFARKEL